MQQGHDLCPACKYLFCCIFGIVTSTGQLTLANESCFLAQEISRGREWYRWAVWPKPHDFAALPFPSIHRSQHRLPHHALPCASLYHSGHTPRCLVEKKIRSWELQNFALPIVLSLLQASGGNGKGHVEKTAVQDFIWRKLSREQGQFDPADLLWRLHGGGLVHGNGEILFHGCTQEA